MKNIFFTGFILINSFILNAQQTIKGKIIDSENGTPIANVSIKNISNNTEVLSNTLGEFVVLNTGLYQFTKSGYQEKNLTLHASYSVIQLELHPSNLNEVIINSNHIPQKLQKANSTITIITSKAIERVNTVNFVDVLNSVSGVFMQTGSLNTNKITIRGIGSRNLYGTSKIRAYFQDIPLTSGNGETTIEDFELGAISRIEIIKGATSSIYGAGLGGTLRLIPKSALLNQSSIENEVSFGSFGLKKGVLNLNHGTTKNSFRAVYSNTQSDGYRENNAYARKTFTVNTNHFLSKKDDLTFLFSYVDLKGFIPSSINEDAFKNNPKQAAITWAQAKGYEDLTRSIIGLSWNHQYHNNLKQVTSIFSSFKDAYEPRPFDILTENTTAIGIRSRFLGNFKNLHWTFGGELFKDSYNSKNFENLYRNFPEGTGSVEGVKFSDFKENRTYYNLFFETNYHASEKTTLSVGLNFNKTTYNLLDRFISNENPNKSGNYNFKGMVSPKFGISHVINNTISLYSNISHGFSPPTTAETLLPEGQINTNIKPETGWNFEIGTRTSFLNNRLHFNLALYRMTIKNLLVAKRTDNDQFIGVNAGKTLHDGLEMDLKYQWLELDKMSLSHYVSYTINLFKFKEFIDNETNFSGNKLTGIPSNVLNTGIDLDTKIGIYSTINYQYVGPMPITDANNLYANAYSLTNFKVGFKKNINKTLKLKAYFGLDNIFNKKYASQILINTTGFGGAAPRYYYPGNPVNFYSGISISYLF